MSDRFGHPVRAPELPANLEWLNVERPLSLAGLRGKVVLLDFWTFCCINCQHVLPQLRLIEERFPDEVVVIGVHCAKFTAEKETYNLRQAILRHDIRHPVVSDPGFVAWRAYAVKAWPTVTLIGPEGHILGGFSGEFAGEKLVEVIAEVISMADRSGLIDRTPLRTSLEKHKQPVTTLSFPGKVAVDPASDRLAVADTEHHRVLVYRLSNGRLIRAVAGGEPGLRDGGPRRARFSFPNGVAFHLDQLLVADTGSHAVRRIELPSGLTATVAGTGEQATPVVREGTARTALNSPWDLVGDGDWVHVAMAGCHQLWSLHLPTSTLHHLAGDGREALMDGPRQHARLAQPSAVELLGRTLWFLDAETSSLRHLGMPNLAGLAELPEGGEVTTAIGTGLFDFGWRDGRRDEALLQHPLGLAATPAGIFIADSYNHRLRLYDPDSGRLVSIAGCGEPGCDDGTLDEACFWEPGGMAADRHVLYLADTNNHVIRRVDLAENRVTTLDLEDPDR